MPGGTEALNGVEVLRRGVAFVRFPAIAGVPRGQPVHEVIAQDLGDHRRRRDRVTARITVDDRFVLAAKLRTGQAVDEPPRGREAEPMEGALHRENGGAPDIVAIDLAHAGRADRDGERPFANLGGELLALQRRQHLRVVEPADRLRAHRKHDGRGDHGACQWTAADFIDSGDDAPPFAPQRRLAFQRWAAVSHVCVGSCSPPPVGTVIPRFSRIRAVFRASRRRKYSFARRTRPFRINPISAIDGECSGKIRSTPTPAEILRTVNVSLMPPPRRAMQMPSNAWRRSFSPSRTRTITRTVSPGAKAGMSVFRPSRSTALSFSIIYSPCFNQISGLRSRVRRSACAARHAAISS